jgi:hypothetical protein
MASTNTERTNAETQKKHWSCWRVGWAIKQNVLRTPNVPVETDGLRNMCQLWFSYRVFLENVMSLRG